MIQIKEAILVEGKYDVNTVRQIVDTIVIEAGGFRIFGDKEKILMLRRIAEKRGLIIMTDSDGAGFVIRNHIKSALPKHMIKNAYIPDVLGKEKRKTAASKEGKLGVEGMPRDVIEQALRKAGATFLSQPVLAEKENAAPKITKTDFFEWGISGGKNSNHIRKKLLKELNLPEHMTANALLDFINAICSYDEIIAALKKIGQYN